MKAMYDGALRIFEAPPCWIDSFSATLVGKLAYAETAFGALYCCDEHGTIHLLNPEDRSLTSTENDGPGILELIAEDPDYFLDLVFYGRCCTTLGAPRLDQHFAYRHPLALGGAQSVENVLLIDAAEHMRFLGVLSAQIQGTEPGTSFHPIVLGVAS